MNAEHDCYLDYNASTPLHPQVLERFIQVSQECFANPSSSHSFGQKAQMIIEQTRETIARVLGCKRNEVWFTSGGTESNNWFLKMAVEPDKGRSHLVVSSIEHKSILKTAEFLERSQRAKLSVCPVSPKGSVSLEGLASKLVPETRLVSVMLANNETGILQPLSEIVSMCQSRSIWVHTDAVAALGKIPIHFSQLGVDALSLSGHKLYAPKGVGVLILREGLELEPLIHGCGQQCGRRSGTENVAGVAAFGKAIELLQDGVFGAKTIAQYTQELQEKLQTELPLQPLFHGQGERLSNTLSVAFPGYSGHTLLQLLSNRGIFVSAGAAANTGEPSSVLKAMQVSEDLARSTLRISLGWGNTSGDIQRFVETLKDILKKGEAKSA